MVRNIVKKSFPILRNKKISIYPLKSKNYSGGAYWFLPFWRALFINRKRNFNEKELIGLIVHELCHFESYQKRGWVKSILFGILYWISPRFRKKEELETENLAVRKGYARETYLANLRLERIKKKISKYYSTSQEIKSYAKSIGKWQ